MPRPFVRCLKAKRNKKRGQKALFICIHSSVSGRSLVPADQDGEACLILSWCDRKIHWKIHVAAFECISGRYDETGSDNTHIGSATNFPAFSCAEADQGVCAGDEQALIKASDHGNEFEQACASSWGFEVFPFELPSELGNDGSHTQTVVDVPIVELRVEHGHAYPWAIQL